MPIAAVPSYLGQDFSQASPGMRFGLYLRTWNNDWSKPKSIDRQQWQAITRLTEIDKRANDALLNRQRTAFTAAVQEGHRLSLDALATAPFTTGLGNEHPLENGFAFLNPYGLPYLPGSGVKGVLRQAARELASGDWGDPHGWLPDEKKPYSIVIDRKTVPLSVSDVLFGLQSKDGDKEHVRGVLSFWDVIPQIKGDSLMVEIMTPHQSHYYQWKRDQRGNLIEVSPHDSGQPTPISFLTVPPGSRFIFHVQCDLAHLNRLAPELAADGRWKDLLDAAFRHAFTWLGFGAKTAVGYGAMQENPAAKAEREQREAEMQAEAARLAEATRREDMSADDLAWEDHATPIDNYRQQFESARKSAYKPGSLFDNQRSEFVKTVLAWEDTRSRQAAAELLTETMTKAWGTPGNKDSKQRLKDAIASLTADAT